MRISDRLTRLETKASTDPRLPLAEIEMAADRFEADGETLLPGYDRASHVQRIRSAPAWMQRPLADMAPADWLL